MKPMIGINLDVRAESEKIAPLVSVQRTYVEAVQKSGGIPILLAPMPDEDLKVVLKSLHGLLLIGGPDYCPSKYGEEACEQVELVDADRQDFDFRLIELALSTTEIPILGICAGHQLLNVALGGSLIQHLCDDQVVHSGLPNWVTEFRRHDVSIVAGSQLSKLYTASKFSVPTSHHQAVNRIGKGLKAAAHADDGIVEAVEHESRPFTIGVQWHPERDYKSNSNLFTQFVQQCKNKAVAVAI